MAVVTFSTNASLKQNFTKDVSEINNAVKGNPEGGTNWEAALKQANDLQGRSGVKKHIIFLSDGDPTYRTSSYGGSCYSFWGTPKPKYTTETDCVAARYYWLGENPDGGSDGVYGAGGSDKYGFNYAAALAEANKRGDAALYVVKTSTDANKMTKLAIEANAVNGEEFDGTNAENLTNAFDQIYSSITSSAKIKVFSIADTLSQWVDPVDFADTGGVTESVTVKNGSTKLTSGYTATYNSGTRTVTVTFNGTDGTDGMVAEKTDVIDVSFKVKPSDAAYADYASNNNYPNTGDADTGDVSAGKQGYYSNADAKLNYCVLTEVNGATSCVRTEAEYPHPVVQVKLGKINIAKQWSDGNNKHDNDSVTVQLKRKAIGATTDAENVGNPITLDAGNEWTTTVDNLVPGYTYSVVETSDDDRYDVSYAGNNANLTKEMVWSSNADAGTLNATITNTRKTVSLSNAISVEKNLTGREWKDSDEFIFKLKADDSNPEAPMPASCKTQPACTVTVKRDSSDDHVAYFGDITYDAGKAEYTYLVTENAGNASAMYYSQAEYRVVVSVMKDETSGEWKAVVKSVTQLKTDYGAAGSDWVKTQPMLFTNKYISASSLPLTGRMGAERWWQLAASGIGVLALLAVVAADQWRRKKRLG